MEYRYLGNSGLRVSALGWGSMMMGLIPNKITLLELKH